MSRKIYINGTLYDKADAKISVYDHGLLYGDGVFEGIRIYGGKAFRLEQHLDRLWESAQAIWLEIPISRGEMTAAITHTIEANDTAHDIADYIRLIVTRGAGTLGIDPNKTSNPQVIVIADSITLYPEEYYENGLDIVTVATQRNHPATLNPRIKSLNYLNNILAKIEGLRAGCVEALMLNLNGEVAECTGDNIFLVRGGALFTPPSTAGILAGITRGVVIELAASAGIEVHQDPLTRHDVYVADECFLTGSAAEVVPVVRVDDRAIGNGKPGPVTRNLMQRFRELTRA
ncbi:MAG: branched-chain-amino-acid transaminase [Planctomycetes bacterium]|nr:branched-chain-amino-acid transaminase [Planctomycetota bacterium]